MEDRSVSRFQNGKPTRITGKVLHVHEPLISPLSKRKCVAYSFSIEQKKSSGKSSYWDEVYREEKIQDFFVEKHGEVVMIKPNKAADNYNIVMETDFKKKSDWLNQPTPELERLLNTYNLKSTNYLGFARSFRYRERTLELGELVTVGGTARWKSVAEPIDNYSYGNIATLEGDVDNKILITDLEVPDKKRKRL